MEKIVLLFSGGLDSYIASKLIDPDVYLYLDINSSVSEAEIENIKRLDIPKDKLVIDDSLDLSEWEFENKIVPLRNLFFVLLALRYGNVIILVGTKGDTTNDKDLDFMIKTDNLLEHLISKENPEKTFPWRKKGMHPSIMLPFKHMTKTGMVRQYLEDGYDKEELWKSMSCYSGSKDKECGNCRCCFRKIVAYINNDIYEPSLFENEPDWEFFIKQTKQKNRPGELEETLEAMKKIGKL